MSSFWKIRKFISQSIWLPKPEFTEKNLASQVGRVVLITGSNAGVGYELAKLLYSRDATVYMASRSKQKCDSAMTRLRDEFPASKGRLEFLQLDLADLRSVKTAAEDFIKREQRLDVLVNNAGVFGSSKRSETAQGHEKVMGTNCLGPYLFTKLLTPTLLSTTSTAPRGSVRVLWAASLGIDIATPKHGVEIDSKGDVIETVVNMYPISKAGNWYLGTDFARRFPYSDSGVISLSFNPGNLKSELFRDAFIGIKLLGVIMYPPVFGAYTELFAGFSDDVTAGFNGGYIIPFGRMGTPRSDLVEGSKGVGEGGSGQGKKFWDWCEKETKPWS